MTDMRRVVEINGVKVEVDLRTAKRVEEYKVGDSVKVLVKKYGDTYSSHFGMIVAFDEFKTLPTLVVAYIDGGSWSENPMKTVYLNAKSTDVEICHHNAEDIGIDKSEIIQQFDRQIAKKESEISELESKQAYFINMFGKYFTSTVSQKTS